MHSWMSFRADWAGYRLIERRRATPQPVNAMKFTSFLTMQRDFRQFGYDAVGPHSGYLRVVRAQGWERGDVLQHCSVGDLRRRRSSIVGSLATSVGHRAAAISACPLHSGCSRGIHLTRLGRDSMQGLLLIVVPTNGLTVASSPTRSLKWRHLRRVGRASGAIAGVTLRGHECRGGNRSSKIRSGETSRKGPRSCAWKIITGTARRYTSPQSTRTFSDAIGRGLERMLEMAC